MDAAAAGAITKPSVSTGWLRAPAFDLSFIVGTTALALGTTAFLLNHPALFAPVFILNMWLLGFHHVVATFTRICFDRQSLRQYWPLVTVLPPVLFAVVCAIGFGPGQWLLATIYFYWQAFHYARQSYGISMAYARRPENAPNVDLRLNRWMLYSVPLWGVLQRSHDAPEKFLGLEVWFLPVPLLAVQAAALVALLLVTWWCIDLLRGIRRGALPLSHALYGFSHIVVFAAGYLLVGPLDLGWLLINIWHNAQYLLFVWHFNNKRFADRVDPERPFLSNLSRRENVPAYLLVCLAISTVGYAAVLQLSAAVHLEQVTLVFLVAQTLNYHHYIVDGIVWRSGAVAAAMRTAQAPPATQAAA